MKKISSFCFIAILAVISILVISCASSQTQAAGYVDNEPPLLVIINNLSLKIIDVSVSPTGRNSWVNINDIYISPNGQNPWNKLDNIDIPPNYFMYTESLSRISYDIRIRDSEGNTYTFLNQDMREASGKMLTITADKRDR